MKNILSRGFKFLFISFFAFFAAFQYTWAATPTASSLCSGKKGSAWTGCVSNYDGSICATWSTSYLKGFNTCDVDETNAYNQCTKTVEGRFNDELKKLSTSYSSCDKNHCNNINDTSAHTQCMKQNCPNSSYLDQEACYSSASSFFYSRRSSRISVSESVSKSKDSASNSWKNNGYEINYDSSPCSQENFKSAIKVVGKVISIIQIVVPILLVVMAMVDIVKGILAGDDAKSRKNISILIKRLVSAIIIFFVIAIIRLVCQLIGSNSIDSSCLSLISNPWN